MGKTLYLECRSGISGDMLVGALLDLGADADLLKSVLESVPADGFSIKISRTQKNGRDCTDFDVILDSKHENHDHDMQYLHGHPDDAPLAMDENGLVRLDDDNKKSVVSKKEDTCENNAHRSKHIHRSLKDVTDIINRSKASNKAKELSEKIFSILAQAESEVHDVPVDKVHFHEVGAIDSIADILAIAVCIDDLGVERVVVPAIYDGSGTVRTQHGILPVPVPAVNNIALKYGITQYITEVQGEMVTPTGAAAVAALRTDEYMPQSYRVVKEGCGSGKRSYDAPCYLMAQIIEPDRWQV